MVHELEVLLRDYFDQRPREARYAAALYAVGCTMLTWEQWAQSLGTECPHSVLKGPYEAQDAVRSWLAGNLRSRGLFDIAKFTEKAWLFAKAREDDFSKIATNACASALLVILVALEEATGERLWNDDLHLADAVIAASAVMDEVRDPDAEPFISRWMDLVEVSRPLLH